MKHVLVRSLNFLALLVLCTAALQATAPTVSTTSPTTNKLNVAATSNITITFDQAMDNATLTSSTIKVHGSYRGYYSGSFSYGANSVTINPDSSFKPGEIITVTVTTGVQNASSESMASPRVFNFTVDASTGYAKFRTPVNYSAYGTGSGNHYSVLADLDKDGDIDIASTTSLYNTMSVMLNNGDGTYASTATFSTLNAFDINAADVDGDGDMDLLVANNNAYGISVFVNNGSGSFSTRNDYAFNSPQSNAQYLVTVDIDGDGDIDVVANDLTYNYLHVMKNNGSGVFSSTGTDFEFTTKFGMLESGDLDKDGDMDIVAACATVDSVEHFINDGAGNLTFSTRYYWTSTDAPTSVLIADINSITGDKQDLVWLNGSTDYLTYFKDGSGIPLFTADNISVGSYPVAVKAADTDTDGDLDLLVANYNDATFSLLANTGSGTGTFTQSTYTVPDNPDDLSTADLDGDGDMDVVTINNDATVSIFANYNGGHVSSVTPVNGALDVAATSNVVIIFDENINSATLTSSTVKIIGSISGAHSWTLSSYNSGTYTATIDPTTNFKPGEVVTITISTEVQNNNSVALENGYSTAFVVETAAAGTFGTKTDYTTGDQSQGVILADINADGYPDAVTANYLADNVSVLINNGDGTYASAVNYSAGTGPTSVAAGDVDGDGDLDLVVALNGANQLARLLNNGTGVFGAATTYNTSAGPYAIALSDVDGDGDLDAAYTRSSQVMTQLNDGSGAFSNEWGWSSGDKAVTLADVDNDGDQDMITVSYSGFVPNIFVYRNAYNSSYGGWGYFGTNNSYSVDADPTGVVAADFNGDGYVDIVTTNLSSGNGTINYLANNQNGTFAAKVAYTVATSAQPRGLSAVDIDSDGDLDLVVANGAADLAVVFANNGSGVFTVASQHTTGDNPYAIASADVDGDSDMDIVTANYTGDNISVLKGTTPVQISSISPTQNDLNITASSNVVITFNQSMNASTLNSSTIMINGSQRGKYTGSYNHVSGVLTFNPDSNFKAGEVITVLVKTGVQNVDGAALSAPYQWSFVVAASAEGTFGNKQDYSTIDSPFRAALGDIDGDGDIDVVTANNLAKTISVLLNDGSGVLSAADTSYEGAAFAAAYNVVADLDADGDLDVAVANIWSNSFSVMMNNGNATFADPVVYSFSDYFPSIAVADFNADGYNDLVIAGYYSSQAVVYFNAGDGTFTAQSPLATGTGPKDVGSGDIDGDGDMDIVTTNYDANSLSIFNNNGDGTFTSASSVSPGISYPDGVAIGDLDGDGDADLAISAQDDGQFAVLLNPGNGAFSSSTAYTNTSPSQTKLSDIDGDGDLDFVTSEPSANRIYIRTNNGSGIFSAPAAYSAGSTPRSVALADMDSDGDLDIVSTSDVDGTVSILYNIELVQVNSTSPTAHAVNVDANSNITATFNVDINPATLVDSTVIVHGSMTGKVAGVISYDSPSKTMTFNSTNNFLAGEEVSITLTTDIKNTNGISLHSSLTNTFTVRAAGAGNFVYADSIPDYPVSFAYINSLNSGDVTGDGKSDILGSYNTLIKVFKNNTTSFDSISTVSINNTQSMPLADLDNDGDMDIMQSNYSNGDITALLNDGAGNFTAQSPVSTGINNAPKVVLKDMDNDGYVDAMMNGSGSQQVYLFYNDGAGTFSNSVFSALTTHYDIYDYTSADVDNDGDNDIITIHSGNGNNFVTITLNNKERSFASPVDYTIAEGARKMAVADANGDGYIDIIVANQSGMYFSVLFNNGDGTFASAVDYNLGMDLYQIATGDVDGDGDIDLLVRGYENNAGVDQLSVAYNNGSGGFSNQMNIDIKSGDPEYYYSYTNAVLLDFDSDGDLDFAVHAVHYNPDEHQNILLFENTTGSASAPTTAASSITTDNNYGTSVKISWTNGNGSRRLVLVKQGSAVDATPADNSNFAANSQFGSGTLLGTGNYVVYGGVGSTVTVTGLSLNTTYHVSVFEMNGIPGSEKVLTTSAPTASFTTNAIAGYPFATTAGSAISFNGASSIVDLPITSVPSNLTVEMWVKVTDSSNVAAFFTRGPSGGGGGGGGDEISTPNTDHLRIQNLEKPISKKQFGLRAKSNNSSPKNPMGLMSAGNADTDYPIQIGINNGHFYASVYDDNSGTPVTVTGSTAVYSNQWYHVAFTMSIDPSNSDGYYHLYVNGTADADSQYVNYFYDYGSSFGLGYDGSAYFDGQIDEVQIRNSVLSISDIRASMHKTVSGFPTDLLGYWQFNEGSGSTSANLLNSTYDASLTSTSWVTSTIPLGGGTATSTSVPANTLGLQTIGNVKLNMTDGFDVPTDVVVSEVTASPSNFPTNYSSSVGSKYFIIDAFPYPGDGTFSTTLTLTYGAGVLTDNTESNYILYKRSSTSEGDWTSYGSASSVNISTGEVTWTNITSFSQAIVVNQNDALPVELISFSANVGTQTVELHWKTAAEVNNAGFEVERSIVDAKRLQQNNWKKIGYVEGNGTSNTPHEYSFSDKSVQNIVRYRLKQIDRDGQFRYSQSVEVIVAVPKVFALDQNYPNPFNPATTIGFTLEKSGIATLKIYDIIGREVATLVNEPLEAGVYHQKQFDARGLASGIYFARLVSGGKTQLKKMMLMK
ncbi:MAG: FG-GAP-like repeat-containing protein [Bacteroidota bacterium]